MRRRNTRHRAFDPDPDAPRQCCDAPGCDEEAGYRAPRSRTTLNDYFWFCLEHVREYNARWDYYKGMSAAQIEAQLRSDVSWDRPSWKAGHVGRQPFSEEDVLDPLDILNASRADRARRHRKAREPRTPEPLREPLSTMGLNWPVSFEEVKIRYKNLARKHHPDINHGDRDAEEKLKVINVAYSALRAHFASNSDDGLEKSA
ncbi:J domain-containing protein [Acetobacter fallax]|uniref:DnaJ domain-containing protein n=1 Tax=Acetobacter fallax TaxID=1737473 RepID=A0ABX0KB71_9PROT|nr:DnaJ domain-containing protein [Acetobacter fallax]NHO32997.1 DnaJ domain-containing protein [Acetobacter fallax]NHO36634.1 DnaJ domain-containing protein [Acetobacter fallax]